MMREHPILFSAPMIRAILAGQKTVTRRIVKPRHPLSMIGPRGTEGDPESWGYFFDGPDHNGYMVLARDRNERHDHGSVSIPCPYGAPGERLWVRETHALIWPHDGPPDDVRDNRVEYRADTDGRCRPGEWPDDDSGGPRWKPSIFMPRWASRITLEVVSVRVERLQEITGCDAIAEGIDPTPHRCHCEACGMTSTLCTATESSLTMEYRDLWRDINGAASWDANPWVWVVEFRRVES